MGVVVEGVSWAVAAEAASTIASIEHAMGGFRMPNSLWL
jgi:hypothetical protein